MLEGFTYDLLTRELDIVGPYSCNLRSLRASVRLLGYTIANYYESRVLVTRELPTV